MCQQFLSVDQASKLEKTHAFFQGGGGSLPGCSLVLHGLWPQVDCCMEPWRAQGRYHLAVPHEHTHITLGPGVCEAVISTLRLRDTHRGVAESQQQMGAQMLPIPGGPELFDIFCSSCSSCGAWPRRAERRPLPQKTHKELSRFSLDSVFQTLGICILSSIFTTCLCLWFLTMKIPLFFKTVFFP